MTSKNTICYIWKSIKLFFFLLLFSDENFEEEKEEESVYSQNDESLDSYCSGEFDFFIFVEILWMFLYKSVLERITLNYVETSG